MPDFISFAIGDNVTYTRWGSIEETHGIISDCSMSDGSLSYGIDGCAWFNVEDNHIKLVSRATEDSVAAIYSLLGDDDGEDDEDEEFEIEDRQPLDFSGDKNG
jgi:hypothetical protein